MRTLAKWGLPFLVIAALIATGSAVHRLVAQERSASQGEKSSKDDKGKENPERVAAFRKAFADSKTTLVQAINAAETETKGKAHAAEFQLGKDGKLELYVGVVTADKLSIAIIDPATGKVTKVKEHGQGEHGDDDDDDDDDHR
jgi:hypothetical protein